MPKTKDPYLVLGVPRGADVSEIKRAYRKLVLTLHPDQSQDADDAERLREVQHAYEALGDRTAKHADLPREGGEPQGEESNVPIRRSDGGLIVDEGGKSLTYAQWRHGVRFRPEPFATEEARSLTHRTRTRFAPIDELLGGVVPEILPNRPGSIPKDLFVEVALTRDEARTGGTFPLSIPLQVQCKACLGSGLGSLTEHCSRCGGRGFTLDHKDLELVVPPDVSNGQETQMQLGDGEATTQLRVVVRLV